ncbi:MAG: glycosyltransferase family 2 protein [Bacteroidia bacterium]
MTGEKNMVSIIIPCYNEEDNIALLYRLINEQLQGYIYGLIFIDDGSTDNTLHVIRGLSEQNRAVKYLSFSRNFGHQNALKAGIDYANGDCVIMMDADLQHPPGIIPEMIKKWQEGFDIVYTLRKDNDSVSFFKKRTSKLFYRIVNYLSDIKVEDGAADYRLIDRKVADVFKYDFGEYFLFIRGLTSWVGFKQYAITYTPQERHSGKSKYSLFKMIGFALYGITSLSMKPLRLATILGMSVSILSFFYGLYALFASIFTNRTIQGWTSTILTILFIGGIQMFLLGIIGEYLGKLFFEVKKRPHYILKDTNCEVKTREGK